MSTIQRPFISRIELKDAVSSKELVSFFLLTVFWKNFQMVEFYEVDIFTMKREEFGSLNKGVYERRVHGRQKF